MCMGVFKVVKMWCKRAICNVFQSDCTYAYTSICVYICFIKRIKNVLSHLGSYAIL